MRTRSWAALGLALLAAVWGGAGFLLTKPTDFHDYRKTAVQSAQSAYHAVATAEIVGDGRLGGRMPRPYTASLLDDARDALAGAAKQFAAVTPVDGRTEAMRDELGPLLLAANTGLAHVQSAVEDDDAAALREAVDELTPVGDRLSDFIEEHR